MNFKIKDVRARNILESYPIDKTEKLIYLVKIV